MGVGISFVLLFVTALCTAGSLRAQEYRATITGIVTDTMKAAVVGANVTVRNLDTNDVVVVKTNQSGVYSVPYLHPGRRYQVTVEAPGFKKAIHPPVVLSITQTLGMNFTLEVGNAATQEVTVSATQASVALDTGSAERGTVVDNKIITEEPIDGRNPLALMDEVAGVTNENGPGSQGAPTDMYNASWYTINGGAAQNTEYQIDGQPDNSVPWWSSGPSAIPSIDAIQEFKVITNPYDASLGRTTGGVVSMQLKSGGNAVHGTAYEFAKRGYMDANRYENGLSGTPRPAHTEDQFGAELDGPVWIPHVYNGHNRTFFMFNAELLRQKLPQYGFYDVPNAAWLNGDFSDFTDSSDNLYPVYDANTADAANNYTRSIFRTPNTGATACSNPQGYNCVPVSRFNPIAVNIVKMAIDAMKPTPNVIPGAQPWENIWVNRQPQNNTMNNYIAKVDQVIGTKDRLSFNYIHDDNLVSFLFTPANVPWENGEHFQENHQNAGIDWIHTQSANLLFDVHTSYQRYWRSDGFPSTWGYDPTQLGWSSNFINTLPLKTGFPQITWSMQQPYSANGQGYGAWPLMSRDRYFIPDDTFSIGPEATWNVKNHVLHIGADLRTSHVSEDTNWTNVMQIGSNGEATQEYWDQGSFDDGAQLPSSMSSAGISGNAFLDFLLGQPNSVAVSNYLTPTYTWHYIAPYVQDDWKVTPRLTLNIGFRYDFATPPTTRHDWASNGFALDAINPIDTASLDAAFPNLYNGHISGGYTFAGVNGGRRGPWQMDWTKFQPRLGFAYLLRNSTVVRGGAGRLVSAEMGDQPLEPGFTNNPTFVNSNNGGETYINSNSPDGMLSNPFFNSGGIPRILGSSMGLATLVGEPASFYNPNHKWPYVYQYSLGVEQVISNVAKLEVSFVGSNSFAGDVTMSNLAVDENLYTSCNDMTGTASNPQPRMNCQKRVPNPLYRVSGVQGFMGSSTTLANLTYNSPYPGFEGSLSESGLNWGRGWYNSLQTTYNQQASWGEFNASWTWSKTMQAGGYVDQNYLVPMRSIAGTDRTHRFTLQGVFHVPVGRGQKYFTDVNRSLDAVIGGWELATAAFLETGEPFPMPGGYNVQGSIHGPKQNRSSEQLIDLGVNRCVWQWVPSTSTVTGYFQPNPTVTEPYQCSAGSGWYPVAPYAPHSTQPYTTAIRVPGTNQLDANLAKMFILTKQFRLQTRLEVTNVLNHPTFYYDTSNSPTNWDFGTVDKTYGQSNNPRYVQIAVKLLW